MQAGIFRMGTVHTARDFTRCSRQDRFLPLAARDRELRDRAPGTAGLRRSVGV